MDDLIVLKNPAKDDDHAKERIGIALRVIYAAMARNYPEMTIEELDNLIAYSDAIRIGHYCLDGVGDLRVGGEAGRSATGERVNWPDVYGTIILRTGWTYEYVDDLPLCRTVEFIDYLGGFRRRGSQGIFGPKKPAKKTEEENSADFIGLQTFMPAMKGIPPGVKKSIEWAERMMAKHGLTNG